METPRSAAELSDIIRAGARLRLVGHDSKRGTGAVNAADTVVALTGFDRVIAYEPDELVLTVEAGVPLAQITALLAARGQHLAFEPHGFDGSGGATIGATIGGVIASNLAGPRRIAVGAVRDHFLGFEAVNGAGTVFRGGGRVVKNVTGFDLPKLLAGSWGTLAALTMVTLKVMPAPPAQVTLVLAGLGDATAVALMNQALGTQAEITGAAHFEGETLLRLEGFAPSVAARQALLLTLIGTAAPVTVLDGEASRARWQAVGAGAVAGVSRWRLSVPATVAAHAVAAIAAVHPVSALYDWGGALVWVGAPAGAAATIRAAAAAHGGHAMVFSGTDVADVPMFDPPPAPLAALNTRVRASLDPAGVFANRMGG